MVPYPDPGYNAAAVAACIAARGRDDRHLEIRVRRRAGERAQLVSEFGGERTQLESELGAARAACAHAEAQAAALLARAEAAEARAVVGAGAGASGSQAEAAGGAGTTAGGSDSEAEFDGDTGALACWGAVGGAGAMLAVETLRASWDSGRTFRTGVDPSEVSGVELVPVRGGAN